MRRFISFKTLVDLLPECRIVVSSTFASISSGTAGSLISAVVMELSSGTYCSCCFMQPLELLRWKAAPKSITPSMQTMALLLRRMTCLIFIFISVCGRVPHVALSKPVPPTVAVRRVGEQRQVHLPSTYIHVFQLLSYS
mmetsp:Transcript_30934/g.66868  ORF Transcript_30934/g.66868 Transcript_30934/m.66868 type:complete len:139 (-) Transcript_30934:71-487(-)